MWVPLAHIDLFLVVLCAKSLSDEEGARRTADAWYKVLHGAGKCPSERMASGFGSHEGTNHLVAVFCFGHCETKQNG